ncbi:hypothetical protein ACIBG8_13955 [Nonomuraea sp. NPDC050556]|uniref:hypothetical protein n=1 Tax=Nonomuraea sp. NPDC050556 TaxID=3364369 RepID=UPI0037A666F7
MAAPRMITCALALATLTLSACSPAGRTLSGGEPIASGVAGGPTSSAAEPSTSAAAPLTPEGYKGELQGVHKSVLDSLNAVAGAKSVKTLDERVERAEAALRSAADSLDAVAPPADVQAQHDTYVAGLRDLAAEFSSATGKVGNRELCTASGVFSDLGAKLGALDDAGEALQSAGDYPADVVTVKAGSKQNRRLSTGAFLKRENLNGRSSLQISNGGDRDAVVTLMRGGTKAFSVYVRKNGKYKVRGVRDGSYRIYFTHGVDWDGKLRSFSRRCSFERFQKSVKFKTTYTSTQILWHDWRITLHAITGGNAPTDTVDPGSFPS